MFVYHSIICFLLLLLFLLRTYFVVLVLLVLLLLILLLLSVFGDCGGVNTDTGGGFGDRDSSGCGICS